MLARMPSKGMSVPHRRRTAVTVAVVTVLAGLAAGCDGIEIEVPPGSLPAPVSIAPALSASAGQPAYVCSAVHKVLTDGVIRLAGAGGQDAQRMLADMAGQVTTAGEASLDPAQRAAADSIAASLTEASRRPDPTTFVTGELTTLGRHLDGTCS